MKIKITDDAINWYEQELGVESGDAVRFFVRYGGVGGRIPGFSIGINLDQPEAIHTSTSINGVMYFIEEVDAWYFDDHHLIIQFDEQLHEPQFTYET